MFSRRKTHPDDQGAGVAAGRPKGADAALDLLADVLRILGETAYDLDDESAASIYTAYDTWARHLLVGGPPPGQEQSAGEVSVPLDDRDFPGARRFTVGHRRREHDYVRRSMADLREALWTFIHGISRAVEDDRATDGELKQQMGRVRRAVEGSSIQEIRRETISAVGTMGRVIAERRRQQREQLAALGDRVKDLRQELDNARERMDRDALTETFSRAALEEHLGRVADLSALFGETAYVIVLDIDHFKWVNDRFGHPVGDSLLKKVSVGLTRALLRREDLLARYGGDEFAAVITSHDDGVAELVGERMLQAVREVDLREGDELVRVSASAGAARLLEGESTASWLKRAVDALDAAKQAGRDRLEIAAAKPAPTPSAPG